MVSLADSRRFGVAHREFFRIEEVTERISCSMRCFGDTTIDMARVDGGRVDYVIVVFNSNFRG